MCIAAIEAPVGVHAAEGGVSRTETDPPFVRLVGYYDPMLDLPRGYEKEPARLAGQDYIVQARWDEADRLSQWATRTS